MITEATLVSGREPILAATDRHSYARHSIKPDTDATGLHSAGTTVWTSSGSPSGYALGDPRRAVELFTTSAMFRSADWLHLPRVTDPAVLDGLRVSQRDEWDFLWTAEQPPQQPDEDLVVPLTDADHPAMTALIDASFPTSTARPGDPRIRGWYGIWSGDRLVACGADRTHGDVGFLAGLVVSDRDRGRGLGATLTSAMTRRMFERYDRVALGVWTHNERVTRLYQRLGYTGRVGRTSVRLSAGSAESVGSAGSAGCAG